MTTNHTPLVSILIPCYNHENYITECIESMMKQTYQNIELIVLDDGSTDNSPKLLEELSNRYNFYYARHENIGVSATLNKAIILSKGKYICICASDDKYHTTKIAKQIQFFIENPKYDMCYTNLYLFNDNGKVEKAKDRKNSSGHIFEDLIMDRFSISAPSVMIKSPVYEVVGGFDESLKVEDFDMWLRIADKYQIGYLDDYLVYYRIHDSNSHKNIELLETSKYIVLNKWQHYPIHQQAIEVVTIKYFNHYAKINKRRAIMMLSTVFLYKNTKVLKGLRRLLFKW